MSIKFTELPLIKQLTRLAGAISGLIVAFLTAFASEFIAGIALYFVWNYWLDNFLKVIFEISVQLPLIAAFAIFFLFSMVRTLLKK